MKNTIKVSPVWTKDLVARRAAEFLRFEQAMREAQLDYRGACARFIRKNRIEVRLDTSDEKFRRATRKQFLAFHAAKRSFYNAKRRLQTAVRNCAELARAI
ncbi:hypothetical protein [Caballeronia sp. DA-9]|uniref:hypothetical protein n=1 Tax=Caballeronia sp. DA-9 TaxID=3436237 RepID=UPI003F66B5F5